MRRETSMAGVLAFLYTLVSMMWILFSDRVVENFVSDPKTLTYIQSVKGGVFVVVTALLLFWFARWLVRESLAAQDQLQIRNNELTLAEEKLRLQLDEYHRSQEEIRILNAELEQRVLERTSDLELANHELESFSYSVSHDLRAPLHLIEGFNEALLDEYGAALDENGLKYLQRIASATKRMEMLIDDMLNLAKVTSCELEMQSLNLGRMAQIIALELKQTRPERQVSFNIVEEAWTTGDSRLIRIVLTNLLENAWKYTSKQEEAKIEFGVEERLGETVYFVRDNGVGFDMTYADKLFGVFQRLHRPDEFEGTGVGLATVQRVIRRHGGRVWAEAELGIGATFYFTLP